MDNHQHSTTLQILGQIEVCNHLHGPTPHAGQVDEVIGRHARSIAGCRSDHKQGVSKGVDDVERSRAPRLILRRFPDLHLW